eukprot:1029359-Amorphochlora_amoeboformis.AAC.2
MRVNHAKEVNGGLFSGREVLRNASRSLVATVTCVINDSRVASERLRIRIYGTSAVMLLGQ